jgi:hypothetical protein
MFFWVFPRRENEICRRFGTLCQDHLQRLDVESDWVYPTFRSSVMSIFKGSMWSQIFWRRFGTLCQVHLQRLDVESDFVSPTFRSPVRSIFTGSMWSKIFWRRFETLCQVHLQRLDVESDWVFATFRNPLSVPSSKARCGVRLSFDDVSEPSVRSIFKGSMWSQIEFFRRFGTLCQVHLQSLDVESDWVLPTFRSRVSTSSLWRWAPKEGYIYITK